MNKNGTSKRLFFTMFSPTIYTTFLAQMLRFVVKTCLAWCYTWPTGPHGTTLCGMASYRAVLSRAAVPNSWPRHDPMSPQPCSQARQPTMAVSARGCKGGDEELAEPSRVAARDEHAVIEPLLGPTAPSHGCRGMFMLCCFPTRSTSLFVSFSA